MEPMDFAQFERAEVPITNLFGKNYVLVTPSGGAVLKYESGRMAATKLSEEGKVIGIQSSIVDIEPVLLASCLFEAGSTRAPVTVDFVKSLPNPVFTQLIGKAKELGKIDEKVTEEAITKEIKKLTERLKVLRAGEDGPKGEPESLTDGSA